MIGKLKGIVDETGEQHALIDVNGVCYLAFCSGMTLRSLPPKGQAAQLVIETHVREDHIHLYGFAEEAERAWFRLLLTVKGVGPKVALSILSVLDPVRLSLAIAGQDKGAFKPAAGVGPKLAERLVLELKGKDAALATGPVPLPAHAGEAPAADAAVRDAVSALANLGYSRSDAYQAVAKLAGKHGKPTVELLIRESLKELAL